MCSKLTFSSYKWVYIFSCLLLLLLCRTAAAELVIIVHPENPIASLTKIEVKKIFLLKTKGFSDGSIAKPVELDKGPTRSEFLKTILQKEESKLSSYRARLMFSGKANPPQKFSNPASLIKVIASNKNAIGFIDIDSITDSVKIILIE